MPFNRPTLPALITRIEGDIQSGIDATAPLLANSVLRVLARVFAAAVHLLYGREVWISQQVIPDTAEEEYLERWAAIYGIYRIPATFAEGSLTVTGIDETVIPEGTIFVAEGELEYVSTADATIDGTNASVLVTCSTAGAIGSLSDGQALTLLSPIAGLESSAVAEGEGLVAGFDAESDDELRARLLRRIQDPPHGGALPDYIAWAYECPTVRAARAWAYANFLGPGTVGVTFAMDREDPIPTEEEVDDMTDYIESKRPVTAQVSVFAPIAQPIDFTIALTPSTVAAKAAVEQALKDFLLDEGAPGSVIYKSRLNEAISGADGEIDHVMTVPAANITLSSTHLATLGDITWA